jgi:molybdate transport system substrate-binding protein
MARLTIARRSLPLVALAAGIRRARADTVNLALTCDTTLAPVLRKVGTAYAAERSVRVFVFPTGPGLILPQLQRDIQNDLLVTHVSIIEQVMQQGLASHVSALRWRNPLVIAGPVSAAPLDQTLAITDPTPASVVNGPHLLTQLGLQPKRVLGAVDTDEVAFLIGKGMAQAGLLYMTDVRTNGFEVIRSVPASISPPEICGACVTRLAQRPNPEAFVAFLGSAIAARLLAEGGLEPEA